jgi:hypothetical protein
MRSRCRPTQPAVSKRLSSRVTISLHGAQLVGQGLVRDADLGAVAQQGLRQALVQALEGDGFGQGHQVGQAVGEDSEHVAAESLVGAPAVEARRRQQQQLGGLGGLSVRREGVAPNRQEVETTHSSPGVTRYSSSDRPPALPRATRTQPLSTIGKPRQGWCSSKSRVPRSTRAD